MLQLLAFTEFAIIFHYTNHPVQLTGNDNQILGSGGGERRSPPAADYDYHSYADFFLLKGVLTNSTHS
ncbi:hypothetical protein [Nostoc sp.]|uniref:hypothetical protein n=1 Tax=Nostoc sp. TaxID=1180 RepID=UPI002FF6EF3A